MLLHLTTVQNDLFFVSHFVEKMKQIMYMKDDQCDPVRLHSKLVLHQETGSIELQGSCIFGVLFLGTPQELLLCLSW